MRDLRSFYLSGVLLALISCTRDDRPPVSFPPPEFGPYAMRTLAAPAPVAPSTQSAPATPAKEIASGQIALTPAAEKTLPSGPKVIFIIAKRGEGGPPVAVKRMVGEKFPMNFTLTEKDVMIQGTEIDGPISLIVRIDADGSAGPALAGDWESTPLKALKPGTRNLRIEISKPIR